MKPWPYLVFAVLFELAVPVLVIIDPDGFDARQLLDPSVLHHEFLVVAAAILSAAFFFVYWKKSRKEGSG